MFKTNQLKKILNPTEMTYLANKHRGGLNNQKGNDFENKFIISKLCELSILYFSKNENSEIHYQALCFIDDLLIQNHEYHFYQIKDIQTLYWNSGNNSLEADCKLQKKLCQALSISKWAITIILSNNNLVSGLNSTNPFKLTDHQIKAEFFPNFSSYDLYINLPQIRNGLTELSAKIQPDDSDLDHVLTILVGKWVIISRKHLTFDSLLTEMKKSRHNLIRGRNYVVKDQMFRRIINSIAGFSFDTTRGFFNWSYNKTDSGVLPYSCHSPNFKHFIKQIKSNKPKSFIELEGYLQ